MTLRRAARLGTPSILTSATLRDLTEKNLRELKFKDSVVLYEPSARNTAPALAFLCQYFLLQNRKDEVVAILSADHLIEKEDEFINAMALADKEAQNGKVVTLGIKPSFPATGYGYIQTQKEACVRESGFASFPVLKFHEKPELATAERFIKTGEYFWNAGIFIFKVSVMAELFATHEPEIWNSVKEIKKDLSNLKEVYDKLRNISIDYAIMEKLDSKTLTCVPADIGWSDIGSWDAVAEMTANSPGQNLSVDIKAKNNFVHPIEDKTYTFVGVEDLLVVDTRDALLITKKGSSQDVKEAVDKWKVLKPEIVTEHVFEERPWGRYEILKDTKNYKSKVIHVNAHQQISYQSHAKREEHWLVTQGKGEVVLDDKIIPIGPGTYVKIPLGAKHRIRNTGDAVIEFIEIQLGTYFGEDDIIRYSDDYKRI